MINSFKENGYYLSSLLWFECEIALTGSDVWKLDSQLVVLFDILVEPSKGRVLLAEVSC